MNDPQAVLAVLENTPALLIPLMREIPEPLRKRRPRPEKWSAHEHFCHLAAQQPMLERLEKMLTEDNPPIVPLSPSPEEQMGAFLDLDLDEAAGRFVQERADLVARLRSLPPEAWERTGQHPDMEGYTVFRLARQIVLHDMLHGFRIEEALYRQDWPEEQPRPLPVEKIVPGSLAHMQAGRINFLGPFETPGLAPRLIRIYLPRNYNPANPSFALYMFDGQNVFDDEPSFSGGWYVHEAVEKLARSKRRPVPVVIAIDHGGAGRNRELSPFSFDMEDGQIPVLLDWVTTRLMPALTAELNLVPGPFGAVVGGSSMGGLAALWSHFHHPESFGGALVMSPSFWLADEAIFDYIAGQPNPAVSRVYMDAGAREDKGKVVDAVKRMAEHLVARGYDADRLMWRADPKGAHSEADWRRRLPKALRFMYQQV